MIRTGVFLTEDEIETVKKVLSLPYIVVGGSPPPSVQETVHRLALGKGLPEIPGYYGADLATGEVVRSE